LETWKAGKMITVISFEELAKAGEGYMVKLHIDDEKDDDEEKEVE
jgi:hypothetical protein